jgi:hypothetical protein
LSDRCQLTIGVMRQNFPPAGAGIEVTIGIPRHRFPGTRPALEYRLAGTHCPEIIPHGVVTACFASHQPGTETSLPEYRISGLR